MKCKASVELQTILFLFINQFYKLFYLFYNTFHGDFVDLLEMRIKKYIDDIHSKIGLVEPMFLGSDIFMISDIVDLLDLDVYIDSELIKYAEENDLAISDDEKFWDNYRDMYVTNDFVASLYGYVPSLTYNLNFPDMDIRDVFKLASDFFENYDKDIFSHYNKLIDGNFIYRCDCLEDSYATTFNLMTEGYDYILFDGTSSNIVLSMTLVHEVIHSYINTFLRNISISQRLKYNVNALDEVYSHFIEFVFLKYLKDINFDSSVTNNLNNFLNFSMANHLCYFNDSFNSFNENDLYDYVTSEIYSYGCLIGLHYFHKYLESPLITKENILNMTLDSIKFDKRYLLNNYGLDENEICDYKVLVNHLNTYK